MNKIEQLRVQANMYTDVSGRWTNAAGVDRFIELLVATCGQWVNDNVSHSTPEAQADLEKYLGIK
jgi:hypothetical protein